MMSSGTFSANKEGCFENHDNLTYYWLPALRSLPLGLITRSNSAGLLSKQTCKHTKNTWFRKKALKRSKIDKIKNLKKTENSNRGSKTHLVAVRSDCDASVALETRQSFSLGKTDVKSVHERGEEQEELHARQHVTQTHSAT
jgi:hypothetical protein